MRTVEINSYFFDLATKYFPGDPVSLGCACNRLANEAQASADSSSIPFRVRLDRSRARFWRVAAVRALRVAACKGVL